MNLRELHSDPELRDLIEAEEDRADAFERERLHDDHDLIEFVPERARRRWREAEGCS